MKIFDLIPPAELQNLVANADLIITHGGVGSMTQCVKLGKKVIAVPRLKKYGEHVNDHQLQIVNSFASQGFIKSVIDLNQLGTVIKEMDDFKPQKYESNTSHIINVVRGYINKL